ncbi:MAG: cation:proton antiporter [Desulfuromonadaceae bacterium]|nr:cation:proton antiporter [Desulfuromonadaceae bacterium]
MPLPAIISALAVIYCCALIGGRVAGLFHVPRVTGYLLAGLLVGPSFTHLCGLPQLITPVALNHLRLISDVALGLILLNIGGQCRTEHLKRWKQRILWFACGEIGLTFTLVSLFIFVLNQFVMHTTLPGFSLWQTSLAFALLLGVIAIATAPAATLMVVREYEADGPVTHTALTLVGLNNIVSILAFIVVCHWLLQPDEGAGAMLWQMLGPLLIGSLIGFIVSVWAQRLETPNEQKLLLLGAVFSVTAVGRVLGISPLLAALMLGVVLANSSPRWHQLVESLRQIDYPLYVAFFVIAGANLHLETLRHLGLLGIAYVLARTLGKFFGARLGARLGRFSANRGFCTGFTLLAQAGVAIGLAANLAQKWPEGGHLLQSVVLGSVVLFELIGPLAIRFGLVRAGEVPILSLLEKRAPQGAIEGLHNVVEHFRSSLGIPAGHQLRDPGDILVKHIMRRNVETILNSTPFNELLHLIAHSRYDRFPVVDVDNHFVGMINYTEIRNLLFEPALANLVVASDLAGERHIAMHPDQTLRDALDVLDKYRYISYFPVIDPEQPQLLLGILSQNDLLATFRRASRA